jgi:membrane-bound lytic murein transglycosylase
MSNFFIQNWGVLLGGGSVTGFLGWIFYGRKNNNAEFTTKVQGIYDSLVEDLKKDRESLKEDNLRIKTEHREDVVYFRTELDNVRLLNTTLQEQFNHINIAYTKEVEVSQNWEKLYHELSKKYDDLNKKYDAVLTKLKIVEKNQK